MKIKKKEKKEKNYVFQINVWGTYYYQYLKIKKYLEFLYMKETGEETVLKALDLFYYYIDKNNWQQELLEYQNSNIFGARLNVTDRHIGLVSGVKTKERFIQDMKNLANDTQTQAEMGRKIILFLYDKYVKEIDEEIKKTSYK